MKTSLVRANGIDIHYAEAGTGRPLVLLHGGVVSTNPIWTGSPFAYVSHVTALAEHFHVIAPDTRGGGRTVHSGGTITFDQLADDVQDRITMQVAGALQPSIRGAEIERAHRKRPVELGAYDYTMRAMHHV